MAVEEPDFKLISSDGDFEVRDYPGLVVAEVRVGGDRSSASSAGFRLLADYIFGGNTRRESIAMTAPATQAESQSEKIAMTAPVTQAGSEGNWVVQFTMPADKTLETLPKPNDDCVVLRALPPSRMAVTKFSGLAHDKSVTKQTQGLMEFVRSQGFESAGSPSLARYDPPWTPWFLRRNEVMVLIKGNIA